MLHTPSHAPPTPGHEQAAAVSAGGPGTQEASGMTGDIVEKLQEKATGLTQERKKRGKTVPEDLCTAEKIKEFVTQSSHPGEFIDVIFWSLFWILQVFTLPLCPAF